MIGWAVLTVAMGVLSTLKAETPIPEVVGLPILLGVGIGMLQSATYFPVLAPLPVSENAHALAFFAFCRSFAGVSLLSRIWFWSFSPIWISGVGNHDRWYDPSERA